MFLNFVSRCNLRAAARVCVLLSYALTVALPVTYGQKVPDYIPQKRSGQIVDGFGINIPLPREPFLPWTQRWWTRIFDSGFKFARIGQYENCSDYTSWDWVEQKRGIYTIPKEVDDYIDSLADNGVTIVVQLLYGNEMYTSPLGRLPDSTVPGASSCHPPDQSGNSVFWAPITSEQIRAFVNYTRWTVNHFRGRVKYYEIWNEPSEYFWTPEPTPKTYAALASEVIAAVHETDPAAKVVFGAFGLTEREFPRQAIDECNCAQHIDVFSYHAYGDFGNNQNPEAQDEQAHAIDSPALLREMVRGRSGIRPDIAFWNDEFNAPSSWKGSDEQTQAKYIVREMILDRIAGVRTFLWELIPGVDGNQGDDYGLIHGMMMRSEDFVPRPAFLAVQNTNSVFSDTTLDNSISVTSDFHNSSPPASVRSHAFRSNTGKAIIAFWLPVLSKAGDSSVVTGDLTIKNSGIRRPVLMDLVTGRVTPLSWKEGTDDTLESLNCRDSVMAIADESYFDWAVLPDAPASLKINVLNRKTTLTWMLPDLKVKGVVIEERQGESGKWQRSTTLTGPVTTYTPTSQRNVRNLYFRVRAFNDGGESAYSNIVQWKAGK